MKPHQLFWRQDQAGRGKYKSDELVLLVDHKTHPIGGGPRALVPYHTVNVRRFGLVVGWQHNLDTLVLAAAGLVLTPVELVRSSLSFDPWRIRALVYLLPISLGERRAWRETSSVHVPVPCRVVWRHGRW